MRNRTFANETKYAFMEFVYFSNAGSTGEKHTKGQ